MGIGEGNDKFNRKQSIKREIFHLYFEVGSSDSVCAGSPYKNIGLLGLGKHLIILSCRSPAENNLICGLVPVFQCGPR